MRIALDATYSLGRNLSGVGVYSQQILQGLASAHPEQHFLHYYRPHRFLRSFQHSLPRNASRRLLLGAPRADLFHALNQRVEAPARRTITTFHDLFVMTGDYSSTEFRARFTQQAKEAAERSDVIIAVSQFTADQVAALLKVERGRIRVVHHGVTIPAARNTPLPGGRGSEGVERENIILFVGAIQRRKNIGRLVKAFEQLVPGADGKPWRLVLAGAADGYGAAQELAAVEASPRRDQIDVLGYVSSEQLQTLYARAAIFAFPSLDEGFGMPVLEAMAHEVPVITSNSSALPEVAGTAALLVDPEEIGAIRDGLTRLVNNPPFRAELARRGLERVHKLTWDVAVEKTWSIYQDMGL